MDRLDCDSTETTLLHDFEPTLPFVTTRSRTALDHLRRAFDDGRSLAVLNSGWTAGADHLLRVFLAEVAERTSVVRVTSSCASVIDGMRKIIQSIGFDPKNLTATELHRIFENFLALQGKRKRRTIVVLEESDENSGWIGEYAGRLVALQEKSRIGLTVILVRQTKITEDTTETLLDSLSFGAGKHINLTPFTQAETRAFLRWRINAAESADIGRVMDFEAITLIHELCNGVPDAIDRLCCSSLELADIEDMAPVTTDIVMRASKSLGLQPMVPRPHVNSRLVTALTKGIPTLKIPEPPRIVLIFEGKTICEIPVGQQRVSIGRSKENDLYIDSPFVSRQHASIFRIGTETAVVDLDSKNGTFVNSRRIQIQTIVDQDEITMGYHSIRFLDPDASHLRSTNGLARNGSPRLKNAKRARPVNGEKNTDTARR